MFAIAGAGALEVTEVLAQLGSAIDALAAVDHDVVSSHERRYAAIRLHELATQLDAQRLRLIGAMDRHGDAQLAGAVNTRSWLHHECRLARSAAGADVRAAQRLREFPTVDQAYAAGEITRTHVDLLTKAAGTERIERLAEFDDGFATAARKFPPEEFRQIVGRACEVIDDDQGAATAWEQIQRRRVHLSSTLDGMGVLDGLLDPESTAQLDAALEYMMGREPDADGEHREISQRRADALISKARHVTGCPQLQVQKATKKRRGRPHLSAVVDLPVLEQRGHVDVAQRVRAETEHGTGLSTETLLRLSCDADISRVITDGESQVLDVGRTTRTIPLAIWIALVVRDRGCTHKGCIAPLANCEAHHIRHWAHGGHTTLDNLELKCWRHHRLEHEGNTGPDPPPD